MKPINQEIKRRREALGLSMMELASRIGVSWQTVQQWENGSTSPARKREASLATAFGCHVSELHGAPRLYAEQPEAQRWHVNEPPPAQTPSFARWPFERIAYSRYVSLSDIDKGYVEGRVAAAIEECEQRREKRPQAHAQ